jgi:hypothetical protein
VGKGEEKRLSDNPMNFEVSLDQQGELTKEGQKYILIIRGIEVFLPHSPVEANTCVVDGTVEKGQLAVTVMEEEEKMDQPLTLSPVEGEEHSTELLEIFSQEYE